MKIRQFYYNLKPLIPARLRLAARRIHAARIRKNCGNSWPILESAGRAPEGWAGWPNGEQFAFILTHDVESQRGLDRVKQLAELEMSLGFRSSFNFIPEGSYEVPRSLREWLTERGFEVGVHDLRHDGKLYSSRKAFQRSAVHINRYVAEWNAVGFRSGFMLRNLEWIGDVNIQYDASTFDTDPFEPQPEGAGTIFPFWVPYLNGRESKTNGSRADDGNHTSVQTSDRRRPTSTSPQTGYVEIPYTLPQDSTLFLILGEITPDIWLKKLDWIAEHRGMASVIVHPDYICFEGDTSSVQTFPVEFYMTFLKHVRQKYCGSYWHVTPRFVADFVLNSPTIRGHQEPDFGCPPRRHHIAKKPKIWIDLDNTPHVPFFEPIIEELTARGFPLLVTARDAFQVCELADKKGLAYAKVGRHHGKNRIAKVVGLVGRALQLSSMVLREKPVLAVSHGSRSQLILGNWLRIPTVLLEDYEFCQFPFMMRPTWVMAPECIPDDDLPCKKSNIRKYPGIKEDVYAWTLKPDPTLMAELGLRESDFVVTVRPPATEAHYHNPESEVLFSRFMDRATRTPDARVVLLPRNHKQGDIIRRKWPKWFEHGKTVVPPALDGMNLLWHSDLVVSGGGTMNREAAALHVPVYSIFRGTIGAVDRQLTAEGRLVLIESGEDVDNKILLQKRPRRQVSEITSKDALLTIVDSIVEFAHANVRR